MGSVLLQAWKFIGEGDYLNLLEVSLRTFVFFYGFFCFLALLILGEDLPTDNVWVVLRLQDLIFKDLRCSVMLGAVEMWQLLHELIYILFIDCFYPPISE